MGQQRVRKTYPYKLMPTPEQARAQARAMERVLWRWRDRDNAGLHARKAAWEQCRVWVRFALQSAPLPGLKEVRPASGSGDLNAQVLQDVLHRLDTSLQAFFRRVKSGQTPGYPRSQGRNRAPRAGIALPVSPLRRAARRVAP
jgi:putative transposase